MYPVRKKGPQQLRREERMLEVKEEAEATLLLLVGGERIFRLRRELRLDLAWLALSPEWAHSQQLRALPTRMTASAALQVRNYTTAELDRFVTAAQLGDNVLSGVLSQGAITDAQRLKAIHHRSYATHGRLERQLVPGFREDLWTTASVLVCESLPLLDEYRQRLTVNRLLLGGWPAVETFQVLYEDAHRSMGIRAQEARAVRDLITRTLLVLGLDPFAG